MTSRITSAYQQFSHQIRRTGDSSPSEQLRKQQRSDEGRKAENSQGFSKTALSREQRQQLRQLRETGTLENLSAILSQDEEALLEKLFSGNYSSYTASANERRQLNGNAAIRGGLVDTKM